MKELKGNMLEIIKGDYDAIGVTTNGFVKKNGECVMGRGIAQTFRDMFPERRIAFKLGSMIMKNGNHVYVLGKYQHGYIFSFPVKHNWWEQADIELIERSCKQLVKIVDNNPDKLKRVILPRAGCGNGKLKWSDVKPIMEKILDDRFYVVTF